MGNLKRACQPAGDRQADRSSGDRISGEDGSRRCCETAGRVREGIQSAFNFPRRRWLASLAARSARQETSTRQRPSFRGS